MYANSEALKEVFAAYAKLYPNNIKKVRGEIFITDYKSFCEWLGKQTRTPKINQCREVLKCIYNFAS